MHLVIVLKLSFCLTHYRFPLPNHSSLTLLPFLLFFPQVSSLMPQTTFHKKCEVKKMAKMESLSSFHSGLLPVCARSLCLLIFLSSLGLVIKIYSSVQVSNPDSTKAETFHTRFLLLEVSTPTAVSSNQEK